MIIDAHAHIYPTKIAEKATKAIGTFYDLDMQINEGTPEKLIEEGRSIGVDKFIVHSCATKPHQVRSINEFIKEEIDLHKEFIGFMTLHQDLTEEEMEEEVCWCIKNGFKGIKLHPDFQKFYIDEEKAEKIYRVASKRLPILLHVGDDRYEYSKPKRLANVAKKFPDVNFIAAHFGGYRCWEEIDVYQGLDNIYFDTSSSLDFITGEKARDIIDKFGAEKFFFGTDFPMWKAREELERFNTISLNEEERQMILHKNIEKLLKI